MDSKLRQMRKARGVSQEDLADAIGVKKAAISKYELKKAHPTIDRLKQIADFLQCRLSDLIEDDNEDPKAERMLALFRELPPEQQDAMLRLAASMAEPAGTAGNPVSKKTGT